MRKFQNVSETQPGTFIHPCQSSSAPMAFLATGYGPCNYFAAGQSSSHQYHRFFQSSSLMPIVWGPLMYMMEKQRWESSANTPLLSQMQGARRQCESGGSFRYVLVGSVPGLIFVIISAGPRSVAPVPSALSTRQKVGSLEAPHECVPVTLNFLAHSFDSPFLRLET